MSDCDAIREQLLDSISERLSAKRQTRIDEHLQTCAECSRIFARERALSSALAQRPTYALPPSLRAKLTSQVVPPKTKPRWARVFAIAAPALAAAMLALFVAQRWYTPDQALINEAVNDHLRVVYAEHPIEIESGGIHQVKPWFTGRLDFAPVLSFSGDDEFPMAGGAIGLFVDRKAATFLFKHKLHSISLFVFRSEGLAWPLHSNSSLGALPCTISHLRGFNTLLWKDGDLGYALVSDVDASELQRLGVKISTR